MGLVFIGTAEVRHSANCNQLRVGLNAISRPMLRPATACKSTTQAGEPTAQMQAVSRPLEISDCALNRNYLHLGSCHNKTGKQLRKHLSLSCV